MKYVKEVSNPEYGEPKVDFSTRRNVKRDLMVPTPTTIHTGHCSKQYPSMHNIVRFPQLYSDSSQTP